MKLAKATLVVIVLMGLITFRLTETFDWDPDWNRDLAEVGSLISGKWTLIGPRIAGSAFLAPYYYYWAMPAVWLAGYSENGLLLFNAMIFAVGIGLVYLLVGNVAMVIGLWPTYTEAARHPGNGYTYLPILMVLTMAALKKRSWSGRKLIMLMITWGILINFHPTTMVLIVPITIKILWESRKIGYGAWVLLPFVPLIMFEMRHGWLMTRELLSGATADSLAGYAKPGFQPHHWLVMFIPAAIIGLSLGKRYLKRSWIWAICAGLLIINLNRISGLKTHNEGVVYEGAVETAIKNKYVDASETFNVLELADESKKVVSGNQYRFFLRRQGLVSLPPENYRGAQRLLVFSRIGIPANLNIWETREFGKITLSERSKFADIEVYYYRKTQP